jgi:hypothetical protein
MNQIYFTAGEEETEFNVYDESPDQLVNTNYFCTYTGANRYGVGRFVMTYEDYDAMVDAAGNRGEVTLHMTSGGTTLQFPLILVGSFSFSIAVNNANNSTASVEDNKTTDMVEAVVFDKRIVRALGVAKAYNVQKDDFSVDSTGSVPTFYSTTLSAGNQYTWQQVLDNSEAYDGSTTPSVPSTWKPRNLIFDNLPKARVLDILAAHLGWIVGYDYNADKYTLWTPDQKDPSNAALLDMTYLQSGGITQRNMARLPEAYVVTFPARNSTDDDPFGAHRLYTKEITTPGGRPNYKHPLHVGTHIAIYDGSTCKNQAELDIIAADLAAREYSRANSSIGEFCFHGLRNLKLDGQVNGIMWKSNRNGATTSVRFNNDRDFMPMQDINRMTEALSNALMVGGGSTLVSLHPGGTRMVWGGAAQSGAQVYTLRSAGGVDGDASTMPAVFYNVYQYGANPSTDNALAMSVHITGNSQRLVNATLATHATIGIGPGSKNGRVIIWCDERYDETVCNSTSA